MQSEQEETLGRGSDNLSPAYLAAAEFQFPSPLAFLYAGYNNEPIMFEHAEGSPILNLTEDQTWKLIEGTKHGRLVVTVAGEPDIFPVNYAVNDRKLYLRTAPGN